MSAPSQPEAVRIRGVSRRFGAVQALRDIDLTLETGAVHALVGENGAGKSTCFGILAGRIPPSDGTVEVFGEPLSAGDPRASRRHGIVAIYQELTIVPALSAHANVFLGQSLSRRGWLSERAMRRRYLELCERLGVKAVPAGVAAGTLSVADQQILEIMRALVSEARIVLLDEPTASLAQPEREALLELMRSLRAEGITLAFVSHNLDEVLEIADAITVFRDGRLIETAPRSAWTKPRLVAQMLGGETGERLAQELLAQDDDGAAAGHGAAPAARPSRPARPRGELLLRAEEVTVPNAIEGVSLELHAGQIVGLGGLVGSGRTTLLRALAGLEPSASGRLWVDGRERPWPRTVRRAREYGIALLPEDRKGEGLVLSMSAMENVTMSDWRGVARWSLLSRRRMASCASASAEKFGFRAARIGETVRNLSGGNQQKLLLARWQHCRPRVLLADEPTRGIDIGAKDEILTALEQMAREGLGIVVVSSELEEVTVVSDRVAVLAEGRLMGVLDRDRDAITVAQILNTAYDVEVAHAPA